MTAWIDRDDSHDNVAHLRFDFGKLNLLTPETIGELAAAVDEIPREVSVVTIRGIKRRDDEMGGLSGGLHLEHVQEFNAQEARECISSLYDVMEQIRDLRAVTVCACGEYALGAGLELAMSCDFRLVVDDAVLGLPEIDVGLVTGIQGGLLIRLVGLQAAKELIFTGDPISGERAEELGLVNYAASPESYEQTVQNFVSTLASKPPRIVKWQTDVFRGWRSLGIESGIELSGKTIALCFGTDAQRNAMHTFLNES